ncbi:MAG TPA: sulfatase [Candidatus Polarisedimenticolaceae bacterium]|nr:sulfatase [Candidatus Polarisedimenticolaceae bacterium]
MVRGWVGLAGGGAALGMAAGAARGLLVLHRNADWRNDTLWLGWFRAAPWIVGLGLAGAAAGIVTALLIRRAPRSPFFSVPLAVLAAAGLSLLVHEPVGALRAGSRPSVILVSIDTLRADRLLGQKGAETMPRMHALLKDGTFFAQATSAAPWTLPSHVSLFMSQLPFDHGVRWTRNTISARRCTLAERFRDAGYRTAAFTGGVYVAAHFGLDQGFEVYEDHDEEKEGGSAGIFSGALRWVRGHRSAPFFLFVHTYEAHTPYRGASTLPRGRLGPVFRTEDVAAAQNGRLVLTEEERRYVTSLYDGDVRDADTHVAGFLEDLRREGMLDDAVLVVLSDHGEDLWDHEVTRSPGHGHALYEELVHVPLAVRAPGRVRAGATLSTPVSLLDVAPTLLDLCRLPADPGYRGRSLADALRTGKEPESRPVSSESVQYGPDRFAVREGAVKAIVAPQPDRFNYDVHLDVLPVEIFDLATDPLERDPVSGRTATGAATVLDSAVTRARAALRGRGAAGEGTEAIPEALRERLRSLGYIQ